MLKYLWAKPPSSKTVGQGVVGGGGGGVRESFKSGCSKRASLAF